jgi:hypothetical protein
MEVQFSTVCGEECQLVQTEVLCYQQQNVDLPPGTIRSMNFVDIIYSPISGDSHHEQPLFSSITERRFNVRYFGIINSSDW